MGGVSGPWGDVPVGGRHVTHARSGSADAAAGIHRPAGSQPPPFASPLSSSPPVPPLPPAWGCVGPLAPLVAPAGAHARLDGSHPSNGQELEHLPHHVSVTLDAKPATLEGDPLAVYAPGGERIDTGQPWLEDDHETIGILLDPETAGPKGDYELLYRVVSTDNHVISGRVAFTTTAAGPPEAGSTPRAPRPSRVRRLRPAGLAPGRATVRPPATPAPATQPAGVATTIAPDDPHAEHLAASQPSEPSEAVDDERPFMHGFDSDIRPRLAAVAIIVLLGVGVARRAVRRERAASPGLRAR